MCTSLILSDTPGMCVVLSSYIVNCIEKINLGVKGYNNTQNEACVRIVDFEMKLD